MPTRTSLEDRLELLRAQIESSVSVPCAIAVTSARRGDGKSATALGIALSFGTAGYRTLVLDANHLSSADSSVRRPTNLEQITPAGAGAFAHRHAGGGFDVISLTADSLRRAASRGSVAAAIAACRTKYDIVVLDLAPVLDSSLALLLAQAADALIVTVREGRSVKDEDHAMLRALERDGIKILGIVTVAERAIKQAAKTPAHDVVPITAARGATNLEAVASRAPQVVG